ncbi:MAG: SLOG family protein [Clostridiales bacterium]|nr:SLOG family protein [Clostridiales bacterium]
MPIYHRLPFRGAHRGSFHAKAADVLRQPPSFISGHAPGDPYALRTRDNRAHTVCFTGHRSISAADEQLVAQLYELLMVLYAQGYRDFLCGGALGFDLLAAEQVVRLREKHPDVRLIFCLPCADQCARWKRADCSRYERLLYLSDETRVLSPRYYEGCMQARNAYMVDRSYLCVACMTHLRGGTLSTVRYAISQDVPVVNIAVPGAVAEYRHSL